MDFFVIKHTFLCQMLPVLKLIHLEFYNAVVTMSGQCIARLPIWVEKKTEQQIKNIVS